MTLQRDCKILIIGLGLMGGSYAQALTDSGYEVGAIDRRQESIDYALEHGLIRHGSTTVESGYVGGFDLVIFALYPRVLIDWITQYQTLLKSGALLTDVTGVKCEVVYRIQEQLRPDLEFVGAHPMAGREVYGVENATKAIFAGANYIVTPTARNTPEAVAMCEELGRILGFKTISCLSPEEHDEMIGFLSQLTHCIAVALMTCKESHQLVDYTGDSFRDLTRIGKINDGMWSELFLDNREALLAEMDRFLEKFTELKEALENRDAETLRRLMRLSTERRSRFDRSEEPEKKG